MIDFFTKNAPRDHFMPENVFKMKIAQKAPLKTQNSKWCQFFKKAQNGNFKGLEVPKISFCPIFKIKSFICYGGMHQNSEMACGVGGWPLIVRNASPDLVLRWSKKHAFRGMRRVLFDRYRIQASQMATVSPKGFTI